MLGASISDVNKVMDIDPNPALQQSKSNMLDFISETSLRPQLKEDYILLQKPVEELNVTDLNRFGHSFDMVCFSPPFFNYEKYDTNDADIEKQARKKYSTQNKWFSFFVPKLIEKGALALRDKGIFAVQISNTSGRELVIPFIEKINGSNYFDASYNRYGYSEFQKKKSYFYVFTKKSTLFSMPDFCQGNPHDQRNYQDQLAEIKNCAPHLTDEEHQAVYTLKLLGKRGRFFNPKPLAVEPREITALKEVAEPSDIYCGAPTPAA